MKLQELRFWHDRVGETLAQQQALLPPYSSISYFADEGNAGPNGSTYPTYDLPHPGLTQSEVSQLRDVEQGGGRPYKDVSMSAEQHKLYEDSTSLENFLLDMPHPFELSKTFQLVLLRSSAPDVVDA